MATNAAAARFRALEEVGGRTTRIVPELNQLLERQHLSDFFGSSTFSVEVMRQKLAQETFHALQRTIRRGEKLKNSIAGEVAHAMKEWAIEKSATHFCHWFQPQTGLTAEKHDSFLSFDSDGHAIERFSAGQLIQSEPDASSFPSGGMRSTFEARGYTAWDPASPVFIMEGPNGRTLCIPSVFISYHGQALDKKAPLLRSMDYLSSKAMPVLQLFGVEGVERVVPTLGAEQEYFLIDRALYQLRPDLIMCGRTLIGAASPKGQQLEDHYFGSIQARVLAFIQEAEYELYKLGVPVCTRHNEVAPHQYEVAPVFEEANVASDHNQLVMEVFRSVATRHNLALLLHEKPFAGVNGSGKHCNWSLMDSQGHNLLSPGEDRRSNLRFLFFLMAVLKGVHRRAGLIRASVATSGNDHRLGANEAPPAIISVFLGDELSRTLDAIEGGRGSSDVAPERTLELNISKLPDVKWDTTDRNRTSPFAFTGSKFEFRAVPSSAVVATPVAYLNAAVGEALEEMHAALQARLSDGVSLEQAALSVIREAVVATRAIRFEGNNYDPQWLVEAERRGLPHLRNAPDALEQLGTDDAKKFFRKAGMYNEEELGSRYHVKMERYIKDIAIEAACLEELVRTVVLPTALEQQGMSADSIAKAQAAGLGSDGGLKRQEHHLAELARLIDAIYERLEQLVAVNAEASAVESIGRRAHFVAEKLTPALTRLRESCDALESIVADSIWSLPKYREMLLVM